MKRSKKIKLSQKKRLKMKEKMVRKRCEKKNKVKNIWVALKKNYFSLIKKLFSICSKIKFKKKFFF